MNASEMMMYHFNFFKKPVTLIYETNNADCPNCYYDALNNKSSGKYKSGGPKSFPLGAICPVCKGSGKLASEVKEVIQMLIEWNVQKFDLPVPATNIIQPKTFVQTTGLFSDMDKPRRTKRMSYGGYNFFLVGEPVDTYNITPGEYFVCIWKREGTQ